MATASADSSKYPPRDHLYLAALVLGGSLIPTPIVATVFTAAIYIAQPPTLLLPFLPFAITPNWLAIIAGFTLTLLFWLVLALFLKNFTSMESANPVSANHLKSHVLSLRAGFDALQSPDSSNALPKEYIDCCRIAYEQVKRYIEEINRIIVRKDSRWITGSGYLQAWLLVHRAEEAMLMLVPRQEVIREAVYDELALTGSNISALASVRNKLELAVRNISASASQYLDSTDNQNKYVVTSRSMNQNNGMLNEISLVASKNQISSATDEIAKTIDEKDLSAGGTRAATAQSPGDAIASGTSNATNEIPSDAHVSVPSTPPALSPDSSAMRLGHISVLLAEMEARIALRDVRRTICEYRDHLWEGLVTGRNLLMGTALITGLITYVLLCFAIVAHIVVPSITSAIAFYLVGAVVGLFGRLYDESKVENVSEDYNLTLTRIIVTPVLSGIASVVGVLLTALLSLTLLKSAIPQTSPSQTVPQIELIGSFDIERNAFGLLIAAAFALAPNLLINTLKRQANDFTDQLRNSGASGQATSNDQAKTGNKP